MSFNDGEAMPAATPSLPASAVGVAEITHAVIRGHLSDYLEETLTQSERERVDRHVAACQPCRAYLATLRATVAASGTLPRERASGAARQRLRSITDA